MAAAAVMLALAAWLGPDLLLGPRIAVVPVVQRDFVQTVVASGRVEAPHRVSLGSQITGTVRSVPVAEGQTVAAGQTLIELDSTELQAAVRQAEVAVRQAEVALRRLREVQMPVAEQVLRQARITLDNAHAQWQRNQDLFGQGFIGQAALDEAKKSADLAESQWRSAQHQYETARPAGSDAALLEAALAQAEASADMARARLRYAHIMAPVAGTLITRDVERGDVVQPGKVLMVLSPEGETELVVQIDEKNLNLLALGQPAQASADAYPEGRFAAELVYINPGVDVQRGSVEMKLQVPRPPPYLKQDMTVSVGIEVARRPHAMLVPSDAVHEAGSGAPWVLKVDAGRARRQRVTLGLRSGGYSEVLAGLQAGDRLVPATLAAIADGSRLRAVAANKH
ncbi:MAG: efflux RND transporter periplasmic adaptor subunit [Caldimonas sp.]